MKHFASKNYWDCYHKLPDKIRQSADRCFLLLKKDPHHRSLHFKKIKKIWSVRINIAYRSLGVSTPEKDGIVWFWIGNHDQYDKLI